MLLAPTLLAVLLGWVGGTGSPEAGASPPVEKVLIISLPAVAWEDLAEVELPNLDRLFVESGIADLSVRGVTPETSAGDGYVTMGAGTRGKGVSLGRFAFEAGEGAEYAAGDPEAVALEFARRTGVQPRRGELFNFGIVGARSTNSSLGYGAEVGALADALERSAAELGGPGQRGPSRQPG